MAGSIGRAHHHVVIFILGVIRPQIIGANRFGPIAGARHAVRAVQHANNSVLTHRCRTVTFAFMAGDAPTPHGTGQHTPPNPQAHGCHHQITFGVNGHSIWPDFLAFVARYWAFSLFWPTCNGTRSVTVMPLRSIMSILRGLLVSSRIFVIPISFRIEAPSRKSRSSSSNPRRWFASTVSKPWSCSV